MLSLATLLASSARVEQRAVLLLATLLASVDCRFGCGGGISIASNGGDDRLPLAVGRVAAGDDGGGLDAAGAMVARLFVAVGALIAVAPVGCVVALSVLVPFLREKFDIWTVRHGQMR